MPPIPVRSGARERSDRCQYWVWSRGGELGRTALTKHARTRPGSFLGISRILPQGCASTPFRSPASPLWGEAVPEGLKGGSPPKTKPPDPFAGSRADECEERAGDDLFSARGRPPSIVGAAAFHFRVRDGNGWSHRATITSSSISLSRLADLANLARSAATAASAARVEWRVNPHDHACCITISTPLEGIHPRANDYLMCQFYV